MSQYICVAVDKNCLLNETCTYMVSGVGSKLPTAKRHPIEFLQLISQCLRSGPAGINALSDPERRLVLRVRWRKSK